MILNLIEQESQWCPILDFFDIANLKNLKSIFDPKTPGHSKIPLFSKHGHQYCNP